MRETILQLSAAFFGSLGFSLLFGLPRRYLIRAALGGLMSWAIYFMSMRVIENIFLANFLAAGCSVIYAELLARRLKCPATLFLTPAIIPLVPGGSLYETMSYAVRRETERAHRTGAVTLEAALAIAAGISIVITCWSLKTKQK